MSETKKVETKKKERLKENIMGYSFFSSSLSITFYLFGDTCWYGHLLCLTDYYLLTPEDRKFVGLQISCVQHKIRIFIKKLLEYIEICCLDHSSTTWGSPWYGLNRK